MNLAFAEQIHLKDMSPAQQEVIKTVMPNLHDFCLFHDDRKYKDIDFYFTENPTEPHGFSCFGYSRTYDKLVTIMEIVVACKNLEVDDEKHE